MELEFVLFVLLGALAGGFVNGLAGFGTGLTALGLWLYVLPPTTAATLVVICTAVAQLQTLPKVWPTIDVGRVAPFVIPGLIGVPLGTWLLGGIDPVAFKFGIGILLVAYSLHALFLRRHAGLAWGGRTADCVVGFGGGVLGGFAGLSGPLPTVWADVRGWDKLRRRSVFQAFNLSIICVAFGSHAVAGLVTREVGIATAVALPGTFLGAWLGFRLYARLSDKRFRDVIVLLLGVSGVVLILSNL